MMGSVMPLPPSASVANGPTGGANETCTPPLPDYPAGFQYHSLPNSSTHIRLLKFATESTSSDDVCCEISIHELAAAPAYHAVSYTWGDAYAESIVKVDALPLTVRRNCWYALQQVRSHSKTLDLKHIWIDSICINQRDIKEKSAQVQTMSNIFARAERVLACLGAEADDSDFLIAQLKEIDPVLSVPIKKPPGWLLSILDQRIFERMEQACLLLERRAFWSRVWILPEIFAAQELSFLCGSCILDWRLLDRFLFFSGFGKSEQPFGKQSDARMLKVFDWKGKMRISKRIKSNKFMDLIEEFKGWLCSDPRDRIYAFLHLVDCPSNVSPVRPDYSKSCLEVAVDLSHFVCQTKDVSLSTLWRYANTSFSMLRLREKGQQYTFGSSRLDLMFSLRCSPPTLPEPKMAAVQVRRIVKNGIEGTSDCRYIRARIPEHSRDLVPIHYNDDGSYLSSPSSWAPEAFEKATKRYKPHGPVLGPNSTACRRLYTNSAICGWICPEAEDGDFLLDSGIEGVCLVLRTNLDFVDPTTYEIVGQATVNPLFLSEAYRVGTNRLDKTDMKNYKDAQIYLHESDYLLLAAPLLLDGAASLGSFASYYQRAGARVTNRTFSSFCVATSFTGRTPVIWEKGNDDWKYWGCGRSSKQMHVAIFEEEIKP